MAITTKYGLTAGKKTINKVLDVVCKENGVRCCEVAEQVDNLTYSAVMNALKDLEKLNCVSMGAVEFRTKKGNITHKKGYFFEQDLPKDLNLR